MPEERKATVPEIFLSASLVCGLLYFCFFRVQHWLVGFSRARVLGGYTPWMRHHLQQGDGLEAYALYLLVFLDIILSFVLLRSMAAWKINTVRACFLAAAAIAAALFLGAVGYHPPMASNSIKELFYPEPGLYPLLFFVSAVTGLLLLINRYAGRVRGFGLLQDAAVVALAAPACLLATGAWFFSDYNYVFTPALRILDGISVSRTYFQYDLLLSLVAALWLKLKLSMARFYLLGQFSIFAMVLFLYFFSKRFFYNKTLAVFIPVLLLLMRVYSNNWDAAGSIQATPLRLDLWLVLLLIAYVKGPYSVHLGLAGGLILIFSNAFGLIYALAYLQLVIALCIFDLYSARKTKPAFPVLKEIVKKHLGLAYRNILLLAFSYGVFALAFGRPDPEAASNYLGKGIGFLPITAGSFYWYFPVFFSVAVYLLVELRGKITDKYFTTGLYIVLLSIGMSLYFFGRSHENNIINVAEGLLLAFFLALDLILVKLAARDKMTGGRAAPAALLFGVVIPFLMVATFTISHADNMNQKLAAQRKWFSGAGYANPAGNYDVNAVREDIRRIKELTNNSDKLFFQFNDSWDTGEALYYYYGNYTPPVYCVPFAAWLVKKDLAAALQVLLDNGYYLVLHDTKMFGEFYPLLRFNKKVTDGKFEYLWKENAGAPFQAGAKAARADGGHPRIRE